MLVNTIGILNNLSVNDLYPLKLIQELLLAIVKLQKSTYAVCFFWREWGVPSNGVTCEHIKVGNTFQLLIS